MSMSLGTTTVQKNVNTSFNTPSTGLKAIIITNLSGLTCRVTMVGGNVSKTINPGISDWFDVRSGYTGVITIQPIAVILNPSSYAGNTLTFDAIGAMDNEQNTMYPLQLTLPAVTATASGKPVFSAGFIWSPTTTTTQILNVFNPSTSGANFTFHSAKVFTSDSGTGIDAVIRSRPAPDINLATPVGIAAHNVTNPLPVSLGNATSADSIAAIGGLSTTLEFIATEPSVNLEFLAFPDVIILSPGFNLRISMVGSVSGKVVVLTLKWTEDQIVAS